MNDVLYLETDEDITSAIDKLNKSKAKSVSIVAPKRSTLIQSLINLKLLKKAAEDSGKELVLVTGDRTATQLAGRVGLPVAATLKAKASVPDVASAEPDDAVDVIEEDEPAGSVDEPVALGTAAAAGVVAGAALAGSAGSAEAAAKPVPTPPPAPVITSKPVEDESLHVEPEPVAPSKQSKKSAGIPDYNIFQKRLIWIGAAIAAILLFFIGSYFWTSAKVILYAKGQAVQTDVNFTVDPNAKQPDLPNGIIVGQSLSSTRNVSGTFQATGTKDVGTPASGTITLTNKCYNPPAIAAGTAFTASSGQVFLSTTAVSVPPGVIIAGNCVATHVNIPVTAKENGDSYNVGPTSYSSAGLPSSGTFSVTLSGGQMSGGTSKKLTIVTQPDIDKATADALAKDKPEAQKELETKVASGYKVVPESFTQTSSPATSNPTVGSEATTGTVTMTVTYTELSYSKSDLEALVRDQQQKQLGPNNQIYDNGLATATITAGTKNPSGSQNFHLSATAYAGAKIDTNALAKSLTGKKYGDAVDIASKQPGVDHVEITITPGWSSTMPKRASNIHITVKVAPKS